jgi:23S rRNA pseudouridine1911/1915/1917 synthase
VATELVGVAEQSIFASPLEAPPFAVLYEDAALLAVAKPAGLVTHPAYKHPDGTLTDAVFARQAARGEGRPWLLHRLDRETSGVVLFAKTEAARRSLVRQFERRTVRKRYLALTDGAASPAAGAIEAPLHRDPADRRRVIVDPTGQPATTRYWTLQSTPIHALVLVQPLSGRTHQIRVHLASRGAPILGDAVYAPTDRPPSDRAARTLLHAWRLEIAYPGAGIPFTVEAPIPPDFAEAAARLGLGDALARITAAASRAVALSSEQFLSERHAPHSHHS